MNKALYVIAFTFSFAAFAAKRPTVATASRIAATVDTPAEVSAEFPSISTDQSRPPFTAQPNILPPQDQDVCAGTVTHDQVCRTVNESNKTCQGHPYEDCAEWTKPDGNSNCQTCIH